METKQLKYIIILAWFYVIFDVIIALKRQFWPSGPLWSKRVDHMCLIWSTTFWGLVSIHLKSLPPKYQVKKSKTHQLIDGVTTFISWLLFLAKTKSAFNFCFSALKFISWRNENVKLISAYKNDDFLYIMPGWKG